MFCLVYIFPPLSLKKRGGKGGESERKDKMGVCFFKPLKSKIKALNINGFLFFYFGQ